MSQKEKRLFKLLAKPSPKDFRWEEFISVMNEAGFKEECSGGSHYKFIHLATGLVHTASKNHPNGILKTYQIKDAIETLRKVNALPDE